MYVMEIFYRSTTSTSFNRAELKLENGAPEVFQGNEWREFDSDVLKPAIVTILCLK